MEDREEGSAQFDHVTGNQLYEALRQVAETETENPDQLPFQIYDCRETHESDILDLVPEIKLWSQSDDEQREITVKLPKINLDLYELQTGYFLEENFRKD